MTDFTKAQLNTILSALDGKPRNPNTKDAALKAIARHGESAGRSLDDILALALPMIASNMTAEQFTAAVRASAAAKTEASGEQPVAKKRQYGTKQATMIEMLSRPEGATLDQIAESTGWAHHTIRGAISGALKKKLGLTITTEKVRMVGPARRGREAPNKEGAKGSYTIYRITG